MPRPMPVTPHGPRRRRRVDGARKLVLACPRVSPQWELGALRVLMKPHDWTRGAIEHQRKEQRWPAGAREVVEGAREDVARALGFKPPVHFPEAGEYWVVAEVVEREIEA